MANRHYSFPLPYTISSWALDIAVAELVQNHIWQKLPRPMQNKINEAVVKKTSLVITKQDLDALPDPTWDAIQHLLPGQ